MKALEATMTLEDATVAVVDDQLRTKTGWTEIARKYVDGLSHSDLLQLAAVTLAKRAREAHRASFHSSPLESGVLNVEELLERIHDPLNKMIGNTMFADMDRAERAAWLAEHERTKNTVNATFRTRKKFITRVDELCEEQGVETAGELKAAARYELRPLAVLALVD